MSGIGPFEKVVLEEGVERKFVGKWITFNEVKFTDPVIGAQRSWEFVERCGHSLDRVDAVEILAVVKRKSKSSSLVSFIQDRGFQTTPTTCFSSSNIDLLPADAGESVEEAAHRELLEETGYHLTRIISMTPVLFYEPGLSNSDTRVIHAEIDGDAEENLKPEARLEKDEWSLQHVLLPLHGLYGCLERLHREQNIAIDSKLYSFAYGLELNVLK